MTSGQDETAKMVAPQDAATLPKQPCDGCCGHSPARQIVNLANEIDGELQDMIWAAGQLERPHNVSAVYRKQITGMLRIRVSSTRDRLDKIDQLIYTIDAETIAADIGVETILKEGRG